MVRINKISKRQGANFKYEWTQSKKQIRHFICNKSLIFQESIQQIASDLEDHRKSFKTLNDKKDKIKSSVTMKTENVQKGLVLEIEKVEKEMERHFSHQNAENSRLQQQISQLKSEKTVVQNSLTALQRRIADLELQIGQNKNE